MPPAKWWMQFVSYFMVAYQQTTKWSFKTIINVLIMTFSERPPVKTHSIAMLAVCGLTKSIKPIFNQGWKITLCTQVQKCSFWNILFSHTKLKWNVIFLLLHQLICCSLVWWCPAWLPTHGTAIIWWWWRKIKRKAKVQNVFQVCSK